MVMVALLNLLAAAMLAFWASPAPLKQHGPLASAGVRSCLRAMSRLVSPEGRGARMPRRLEPTEYEKRSCAGMRPRLRLLGIEVGAS